MKEQNSTHPDENLLLFLENRLNENERRAMEKHLEQCDECRQELEEIKNLNALLKDLEMEPGTCPDYLTLMMFHYGELDLETERHVKRHLIDCRKCAEEVVALEQEDEICEELLREPAPVTAVPTPLVLALIAILWRSHRRRVLMATGESSMDVKLLSKDGTERIVPFKVSKPPTINEEGRFSLILKAENGDDLEGMRLSVTIKGIPLGEALIRRSLAAIRGNLTEDDLLALKDFLSKRKAEFPLELPVDELSATISV